MGDKVSGLRLVCTLLLLMSASLRGQDVVVLDEIVAKVNQSNITLSELEKELRLLKSGLREEFSNPETLEAEFQARKRPLLKNMIQNRILVQRAEELGMLVNIDVEVAAALEETRKQAGIPSLEVMDQYLRQQGSSLEDYRSNLRERIVVDTLLQQSVYSKLTLLTPEIEAYYQENIDRFTEAPEVELKEILFLTEDREPAAVRRTAEEVLSRLQAGAPFDEMARQHSDGPTASRGGDIGTFKKNSMADAIEEVVFRLDAGEISGVIETEYGLQILKVVSRKKARVKPLEEVRPQLVRELYQKKAQPGVQEFLEDLQQQSYIYVAPKYREEFDVEGL